MENPVCKVLKEKIIKYFYTILKNGMETISRIFKLNSALISLINYTPCQVLCIVFGLAG